jgi:hypothetical protein
MGYSNENFRLISQCVVIGDASPSKAGIHHLDSQLDGYFKNNQSLYQQFSEKIGRILITSLAFILSAPFVPTVANAFKNKEIILSGITIGIIGYTSGNFLGISLAYILKYFSF